METLQKHERIRIWMLIFSCLALLLVAQLSIGYYFIHKSSVDSITARLTTFTDRVKSDITYQDGKWDMSEYNADPRTPHPSGSGGFTNPLYIITNEGLVIERTSPINGLLDTAELQRVLSFTSLQTITTATNEQWRVLSQPITLEDKTVGAIMVSYYLPEKYNKAEVDARLTENLKHIASEILVENGVIDTSHIDVRNVYYDITSEVVDVSNKVLFSNGRVPTYIDQSYVADQLSKPHRRQLTDARTGEPFLIYSTPLLDNDHKSAGIIVAAESMRSVEDLLHSYLVYGLLLSLCFVVPLSVLGLFGINKELMKIHKTKADKKNHPKSIRFNRQSGTLIIDDLKISIPPDTYQFYLCDALISDPYKTWTLDELVRKFGRNESWKTVYDASLAVNRKSGLKLMAYEDRLYRINPLFADAVS